MRTPARRWAVLTAAVALTLTACAQGSGGSGDSGDAADFDKDADLTGSLHIMGFGDGDDVAQTRMALAEGALDGVDISYTEGTLDTQQYLSAVAGGDAPDMIYADRDKIGTFASRGALMPLTACIEGEDIPTGDFVDIALNQVTFNDVVYGIPEFNSVQLTMANPDLLDAAGLSIDDVNGSDWDAIKAATEKMTVGTGGSLEVIGYDSKLPEFLPLWAKANGADLLSADGRTAQLDSPEVVEALQFAVDIYDDQGGFSGVKAFRDSADFFGDTNQYANNELGAMPMEQWYVSVIADVSPDAPLVVDSFRDPSGDPLAFSVGSAWAISADSPNAAAACRYAKLMTSVDAWDAAASNRAADREASGQVFTGLLTGNRVADEMIQDTYIATDMPEPWATAVEAMYESNRHTFAFAANPADAEFKQAWQDAANRVLNGQATVEESLAKAQTEAQDALDKAWADWDAQD